jgi:chorismate synthase
MSFNTFGLMFRVTTFGESHGPAIGCVIDGCPPGLEISPQEIKEELERRATGRSRHTSQRREQDDVQIVSGWFDGRATGTPIALLIENTDARSRDYEQIKRQFRPGHADYTYWKKYGIRDYRGGGRSSARETTMRVAAGALARKWLRLEFGVEIQGWLAQLGPLRTDEVMDWDSIEGNPFFCPHPGMVPKLEEFMDALRKSGDSVGARVNVIARNVPAGLGAPVYGKLDADLASAMMSINAAKGVEIGAGFASVSQQGTEHRDEMTKEGFLTNHAGGILGGISSGQDVVVSTAFKPTSSLRLPCLRHRAQSG